MRVSVNQENLAKGLSIVARAVSSRSTMPILGNILLEAKNNELRLAATNREIGINCWIGAKVEDEGAITIPARLLSEFVNSLPPERIDMDLAVRTQTLHLACARYTANMKGIDAYEFPLLPTIVASTESTDTPIIDGMRIELEIAGLRKMIDQVIFAASSDENRPTLTGVEFGIRGDRLSMAATDGFRLSLRRVTMAQGVSDDATVIVPARSLGELARISADAADGRSVLTVITEKRNQILFQLWGKGEATKGSFHRVELTSELIDARFPDYNGTIPKSHETSAVVNVAELLKAVRVAQLFARDNANIIRLVVQPGNDEHGGRMSLTGSSAEMGDNVSDIDAMVEGHELEIAFNAKYLIDVLTQVDQIQIVLELTSGTRPGVLRPVGVAEDDCLFVLMPMTPPR